MKIIMDVMTSKIEFTEHEEYLKETIHDEMHRNLGVRQEGYFYSPAYKAGYWDGIIDFYNAEDDTFHTGLVNQVEAILGSLQGRYPFEFSIIDNRPDPFLSVEDLPNDIKLIGDDGGNITMRDYQYDAVVQVIDKQVGIVEVATNGGKCLVLSTPILTNKGIQELGVLFNENGIDLDDKERTIENTFGIELVNRYGELEKPSHLTVNGVRHVNKITTEKGYSETVTDNHPMLTVSSTGEHVWKQADQLEVGDWIVSRKGTNTYGDKHLSKNSAYALGALIADGCFSGRSQVRFTNDKRDILDKVSKFYIAEGLTVRDEQHRTSRNSRELRGIGAQKAGFYGKYGIKNGVAKDKEVPKVILEADRSTQLSFLSGYLECEMSIEVPKCAIEVTSASKKLLEQVQFMLLNMGYMSNLAEKKVKGYEDNWYGRITLGAIESARLLKELSFVTVQRIAQRETFYEAYHARKRNAKGQTTPFGKELVRVYKDTYPNPPKGMKKAFDFPKTISMDRLRGLINKYPEGLAGHKAILDNLLAEDFVYSQVTSIEDAGYQPTYDVHMPETHSFIANGIINHNTEIAGAIIQQLRPYLESGERIAFFTNNTSIFTQSIDRIEKRLGIKVGRYGAGHKDIQQVTFVMIPTINASLTADPEKGLKLTGKNAVIKRIAKEIAPKFTKGVNQRLALRNLIKNHPTKSQVDKKVVEELEDILYTCGTDNEIRFRIQGYQAEYQKIVESKNKKVYDKHNEALAFLESVAVMIVDEAHHTSADTWYQSLSKCTNAYYRVALTGSIDRKDHLLWQRLQAIFNKTIIKISNETLINLGHSAKPKITMFPIVSPQGHDESDYMIARDACIVNNEYRNKLISQLTHKYYNEGKGVLILVNIIEHGDNIVELLNDMGIPNAFIHGELPLDYREQQLDNMREGKLKVLIATTIADEGVDISGIDMLILGAGGKSLRQTLQRVGRALRKKKTGENVATIIDFVDYTNKHLLNHSKERRKTYVQEKFEINDIQVN